MARKSNLALVKNDTDSDTTGQEQTQPTEQKQLGIVAQRSALKAAGLKRCPSHARLLGRLPDEAKVPVAGYEDDVSIRPLAEYQKNTSTCRACDHLIQKDWRVAHKASTVSSTGRSRKQIENKIARLTQQRDAILQQLEQLQGQLAQVVISDDSDDSDDANA